MHERYSCAGAGCIVQRQHNHCEELPASLHVEVLVRIVNFRVDYAKCTLFIDMIRVSFFHDHEINAGAVPGWRISRDGWDFSALKK